MRNSMLYLLGFVKIQIEVGDIKRCIDALRKENIIARFLPEGRVDISILSWRRARKILDNYIVFIEHGMGGAFALIPYLKSHFAVPLAISLFLVFSLMLSRFVFDVRVEGNARMTTEQICEELSGAGLYVGAKWKSLRFSEIEGSVLSSSEHIAWLNVHRRGLVAYVTVKEKEEIPHREETIGYANIVSAYDGVVEEVFVRGGSSAVSVGQTIRKGELLISAFDSSGTPTYASGEVYARVYGSFSVFIPRSEVQSVSGKSVLVSKHIKIFNFFINIFKNYRNLPKEYDIIEDKRRILLSDGKPLPIALLDTYLIYHETKEVTYTDEELIALARVAHESAMLSYLASGEVVFVRTNSELTEDGCRMESEICILTQIGVSVPLPIE